MHSSCGGKTMLQCYFTPVVISCFGTTHYILSAAFFFDKNPVRKQWSCGMIFSCPCCSYWASFMWKMPSVISTQSKAEWLKRTLLLYNHSDKIYCFINTKQINVSEVCKAFEKEESWKLFHQSLLEPCPWSLSSRRRGWWEHFLAALHTEDTLRDQSQPEDFSRLCIWNCLCIDIFWNIQDIHNILWNNPNFNLLTLKCGYITVWTCTGADVWINVIRKFLKIV